MVPEEAAVSSHGAGGWGVGMSACHGGVVPRLPQSLQGKPPAWGWLMCLGVCACTRARSTQKTYMWMARHTLTSKSLKSEKR